MRIIIAIFLVSTSVFANVHNIDVAVYRGNELVNEKPTGNICYITVKKINEIPKGRHCHEVIFNYQSMRSDIPKTQLKVQSRITNYHRREYPALKTCAMNVNGTTYGDEIYQDDTTHLYIQILGGAHKVSSTQYDYFLSLNSETKDLTRARVHIMTRFKEYNVDCVDLEQM